MPWILPPGPTSGIEGLVLDDLDLNNMAGWLADSIDMPTPAKRGEWITGADADGALLVRDPLIENRTITIRTRLATQASMDQALAAIEALSMKLEETEQNEDGLPLYWTPADSTLDPLTFYVLSGTITGLPITAQGDDAGWFVNTPVVTIVLTCKPFGYQDEELYPDDVTSSDPLVTLELTDIPGDVPAEGRLVVTDMASQSRAHVEWGLENRWYDAGSPADLLIDTTAMSTSGFSGSSTTRSGSHSTNVFRATLATSPLAVCSTGNQTHVGTFRVKARCYCTSTTVYARLAYKDGDSPYTRLPFAQAVTVGWNDLDLGLVTVPPAGLGSQRWLGLIESYSTTTGDTIDVDVLELLPAGEGYGKGRAPLDLTTVATYSALDDFNQTTGALAGKTLPIGGTWTGAGDADDFTLTTGNGYATRVATSDAATNLGTGRVMTASTPTSLTNTVVKADFTTDINLGVGQVLRGGVVARYTNINNFVVAYYAVRGPVEDFAVSLVVAKRVASTDTIITSTAYGSNFPYYTAPTLRLVVLANGTFTADLSTAGGVLQSVTGSDSALATGGALASGTAGIYETNTNATAYTRTVDNFRAFAPNIDNVIWSGQSVEFRPDGALREDSTGTYYGPVQSYRGGRFLIPPAGDQGRASRVAIKARRNDVDLQADDSIADSTKVEVYYRGRHLNVRGS